MDPRDCPFPLIDVTGVLRSSARYRRVSQRAADRLVKRGCLDRELGVRAYAGVHWTIRAPVDALGRALQAAPTGAVVRVVGELRITGGDGARPFTPLIFARTLEILDA